jgi:hypothetical protein
MKVKELIEFLQGEEQDAEVHFAYNYGDTVVTEEVSAVEEAAVKYSEYHRMNKLVDEDDEADEDCETVVLLR